MGYNLQPPISWHAGCFHCAAVIELGRLPREGVSVQVALFLKRRHTNLGCLRVCKNVGGDREDGMGGRSTSPMTQAGVRAGRERRAARPGRPHGERRREAPLPPELLWL